MTLLGNSFPGAALGNHFGKKLLVPTLGNIWKYVKSRGLLIDIIDFPYLYFFVWARTNSRLNLHARFRVRHFILRRTSFSYCNLGLIAIIS